MPPKPRRKRSFGGLRQLPSKRWQANYTAPDGLIYNAPHTFDTSLDAEAWLAAERRKISMDLWVPPSEALVKPVTFGEYAYRWLEDRPLKPRTRQHYQAILDSLLLPTFEDVALKHITPASVRRWYTDQGASRPTYRAHAYGLLRTILGTALTDEIISSNPCTIRGAGAAKRAVKIKPATLPELEAIVAGMPERLRLMVLLASWCGMRFGELAELRRQDIDLRHGVVRVRRGVTRVKGQVVIGTPKTTAGIRDVAVPPHLLPLVEAHLNEHTAPGRDALLFPADDGISNLATSTLYRAYYPARAAAGREDLRWHDLRHTGAVLAAQTGATLAELMGRLGHSSPAAALRYQHVARGRDAEIAEALSRIARGE
ncbi:tyrosine-type recombinase/integrase [Cellulosimicrobium funkei]|uniref:tyrosine-type recombinase/integrase n=1 Tax=Cellulosimicrobium funkei TaxID=264251 RepID=UPI0036CEAED7